MENYEELALSNKISMMAFVDDNCSQCLKLKPIIKELKDLGMPIYEISIPRNLDLVERYSVDEIPTVIVFKNGRILDHISGLHSKDEYLKFICYFA